MREIISYIWNMDGSTLAIILVLIVLAIAVPAVLIQINVWRRYRRMESDFDETRSRIRSRME